MFDWFSNVYIPGMNFTKVFNAMKNKQADFEIIFGEQADANAELRQTQSASSIRRGLEGALKSFYGFLTSLKNVPNMSDAYLEIYELVKSAKNSTLTKKKGEEPSA